jgi:aminotransferase class III
LIDVSPYKFDGPGGRGRKSWVHVAPIADDYRGIYQRGEPGLGAKYASHVAEILHRLQVEGRGAAAYIAETMPSVGGQIVFPPAYLAEVYSHIRAAGGLCIADEVQAGFGRLGTHFWGFETQSVVPETGRVPEAYDMDDCEELLSSFAMKIWTTALPRPSSTPSSFAAATLSGNRSNKGAPL